MSYSLDSYIRDYMEGTTRGARHQGKIGLRSSPDVHRHGTMEKKMETTL